MSGGYAAIDNDDLSEECEMEQKTAKHIAAQAREGYLRNRGKPLDKKYNLDLVRSRDDWSLEELDNFLRRHEAYTAAWRQHVTAAMTNFDGDTNRRYKLASVVPDSSSIMAFEAAERVYLLGYSTCIASIEAPVRHSFCIADYQPDERSPTCVQDMTNCDSSAALVIDPWMNIVCAMALYPLEFKQKLAKWSLNAKTISKDGYTFFSPNTISFVSSFLTRRLNISKQWWYS